MDLLNFSRLRKEEYNSLAAKIITLFPTEMVGTYYVPPMKKSSSPFGRPIMAKGKLVNQVKNIIFRSGDTNKREHNEESCVVPQKTNSGLFKKYIFLLLNLRIYFYIIYIIIFLNIF